MKHIELKVIACILALLLTGCGTVKNKQNTKMAETYVATAQKYESENNLPEAMEQYQLALTADPDNPEARQGSDRLSRQLDQMADERYRLGMKYYRQGKYSLARKEFLTALRFRPDHPEASKILINRQSTKVTSYVFHVIQEGESLSQIANKYYGDISKYKDIAMFNNLPDATRIRPGQRIMIPAIEGTLRRSSQPEDDKGYVDHVIQPGETISKLAKKYYGDYKQFHIIAQYNDLDDATRISVGQSIKIPKVAGLPFNVPAAIEEKNGLLPESEEVQPQPVSDLLTEGSANDEAVDEQLMAYRDAGIAFYNEGKYEDAIFELVKAVEAMPGDAQTLDYLSRSYVEAGKQLLDQKEYNAAKESFESALEYDNNCTKCKRYIEQSLENHKEAHYNMGIAFFGKEQLPEAISEWQTVYEMDPEYKDVAVNLHKAQDLLKKLEKIKRSQATKP